jgi:UDP-N-acetyl-D-glucosamine dehydrogenase
VPCTPEEFANYDAVLISTAHSQFADAKLYASAKLVIDTRNIVPRNAGINVVRA